MSSADFNKAHEHSDVDFDRSSQHHTLGKGATQAAPGNHGHTDLDDRLTTAETNIGNLQSADTALDGRLDALEAMVDPDIIWLEAASGTPAQANGFALVTLGNVLKDTGGSLNATANSVTITVPGVYNVFGRIRWSTSATIARRMLHLEKVTSLATAVGSGTMLQQDERVPAAANPISHMVNEDFEFDAGDIIRLVSYQNTGGALNITNNTDPAQLKVRRIINA